MAVDANGTVLKVDDWVACIVNDEMLDGVIEEIVNDNMVKVNINGKSVVIPAVICFSSL